MRLMGLKACGATRAGREAEDGCSPWVNGMQGRRGDSAWGRCTVPVRSAAASLPPAHAVHGIVLTPSPVAPFCPVQISDSTAMAEKEKQKVAVIVDAVSAAPCRVGRDARCRWGRGGGQTNQR